MVKDMTKGNPMRLILLFAIPLFIGNIFQQVYIAWLILLLSAVRLV